MARLSELLSAIASENLDNGVESIAVDNQKNESTFADVITTDESTGLDIVTCSAGEQIVVRDVFLLASANIGEVALDFPAHANPVVARLYTSQFLRTNFANLTKRGGEGNNLQLTGNGATDEFFALVNYTIEEV